MEQARLRIVAPDNIVEIKVCGGSVAKPLHPRVVLQLPQVWHSSLGQTCVHQSVFIKDSTQAKHVFQEEPNKTLLNLNNFPSVRTLETLWRPGTGTSPSSSGRLPSGEKQPSDPPCCQKEDHSAVYPMLFSVAVSFHRHLPRWVIGKLGLFPSAQFQSNFAHSMFWPKKT